MTITKEKGTTFLIYSGTCYKSWPIVAYFDILAKKFYVIVQPILVFMSKVDGSFKFSPVSVNFLTEIAKVLFAIVMLLIQVDVLHQVLLVIVSFLALFW